MKLALIIVSLLFLNTAPPVPWHAANNGGERAQAQKTDAQTDKTSIPPTGSDATKQDSQEKARSREKSPANISIVQSRRGILDTIVGFAQVVLAFAGIAGIAGIIVAICTLKKIERQTAATEEAAKAARDGIELVISKERARIEVEPEMLHLPGDQLRLPTAGVATYPQVDITIRIRGTTNAVNVEGHAQAKIENSRTLDKAGLNINLGLPKTLSSDRSLTPATYVINPLLETKTFRIYETG